MDNLTHSLVGALIGQTGLKKKTGLAMPALIIGANLPDVDAACFFWLEGTEHLGFRRGITHGPPALVLLPLILAGLLWGWDRLQASRGKRPEGRVPVHFGWLYGLAFLGCLTHPALDWLNVYGIRLLEPFSSQWFYGDTLFIIDVWLWGLMGLGLWWSLRKEKRGGDWRKTARVVLAAALAYIGMNAGITTWQERTNADWNYEAIASPVPLVFWDREVILEGDYHTWFYAKSGVRNPQVSIVPEDSYCVWPDLSDARKTNSQLDAFLFWSRTPFAERAEDGSIILRDARFYDPRARDRFSLALPNFECVELLSTIPR
ncbi:metal-dependent hydrolase [Aurantiacibacter sp. D1-12]|uniref:metal-dependent hydrolase n=1 Tax=Aurantiacibacter sp. D1-12 TaxID=2993658 RepID=UPI00237C9C3E|nr:metal-dependent hydrolase [Aurantiacibacter sp. D1-12]MDE1468280.1 metal-dependent hydrolase [Aurantiacibacter sp. D1-12]